MSIKQKLKSNNLIRGIGKKINIDSQFRQDAKEVAEIFKEYTRLAGINNVIYAVPSKASSSNYDDFISVINR